jgi:hypothetical protein
MPYGWNQAIFIKCLQKVESHKSLINAFMGCPCGILCATMQGLINVLEKKSPLKDIAIVNVMKEVGDRYYFFLQ